ncbi:MAG: hypothetical protein ACK5L5_02805 [Bacteroidales bacterium]
MNTFTVLSVLQWGVFVAIACTVVSVLDKKKLVGIIGMIVLTSITILAWCINWLGKEIDSNSIDNIIYVRLFFTISLILLMIYKIRLESSKFGKIPIYLIIAMLTGAFFILRNNITT